MERAVIFTESSDIDLSMLPKNPPLQEGGTRIFKYREFMKSMEYDLLSDALAECRGNVEQVAKLIGMSIPFVYKKIKELNITIS